jgi:flagellar assembly protein FliH
MRGSLQQTATENKHRAPVHFQVFEYPGDPQEPEIAGWECWAATTDSSEDIASGHEEQGHSHAMAAGESALRAEFDQKLAEETRRSFEAGRETGRQEGRLAERESQAAAVNGAAEQRTRQAAELVQAFAVERDRFLQAMEREVVELALAVAARILRREAQMDPLLLTGAVRVALGQLSGSTKVRLRVPNSELDLWTEAMALIPNLAVKPAVVAGDRMRLGDCVVETEMGSVDLGIRSQLGEIERGFFDRAGGRASAPAAGQDVSGSGTEGRQ